MTEIPGCKSANESNAAQSPHCDGARCDGRMEVDDLCSYHGDTGRALWFARQFATHDPGVEWPSDKHEHPIYAICAALDRVREEAVL